MRVRGAPLRASDGRRASVSCWSFIAGAERLAAMAAAALALTLLLASPGRRPDR